MKILKYFIYANTFVLAITLIYFGYRYVWFAIKTIPSDRIPATLVGFLIFFAFSLLFLGS